MKDNFEQGRRLENAAWRVWFQKQQAGTSINPSEKVADYLDLTTSVATEKEAKLRAGGVFSKQDEDSMESVGFLASVTDGLPDVLVQSLLDAIHNDHFDTRYMSLHIPCCWHTRLRLRQRCHCHMCAQVYSEESSRL